ncbi:phosphatases II [Imleria badia]|nr:phosphatases II [Imleria badia]
MPKTRSSTRKAKANLAQLPKARSDSVSLILPYLYVGPCSATSAASTFVARQGITHIISVGKKPNSIFDSVTYLRLSIDDDPSADLSKAGGEAITFINKARTGKKSSKIFVHCFAGISRSPAVVAFYLMQSCGMSLKRALGLIISARPNACPNPGFVAQLQQAELELRGSSSLPPDLLSLPSKKEERLALFQEDQVDEANLESSKSAPVLDCQTFSKQQGKYLR